MQRIFTTELSRFPGEYVRLAGWLHRLRVLSHVTFLILRDGRGLAQVVLHDPALVEQLANLHPESVLSVKGQAMQEPQAPGGWELHHPTVEVISEALAPPPFDLFRPTIKAQLPSLLDHASVALRHPARRAAFRLMAASMHAFRDVLRSHGFVEIQTPKIVGSATEGGANLFQVDYFGQPAYLAQSPQFYKQAMVGVFERVFEVGPVFRAEPHDTPRHLSEYVSLDVEMGFITDHQDVMELLTVLLRGMLDSLQVEEAVHAFDLKLPAVPATIPAIHFTQAQELILTGTGEDARQEPDLSPAHERWLGEWARREHASEFLFVTGYPMVKRPFYTHPDPKRPGYSNSFDLLFRGLELVTGGQRLHRYADYLAALESRGLAPAGFAGYLKPFRHGMPPHGGFAIGLERWIARLVGAVNIRETTLFPRDLHRLAP